MELVDEIKLNEIAKDICLSSIKKKPTNDCDEKNLMGY